MEFRPGQQDRIHYDLVSWEQGKPEPKVGVAIARLVPVAVSGPAVPGGVVPGAAADHPVRALGQNPKPTNGVATQPLGRRHTRKIKQGLHVAHQYIDGPLAILPLLFILPEFV